MSPASRRCHEHTGPAVAPHVVQQPLDRRIRAEGRRAELHQLLYRPIRVTGKPGAVEQREDDPIVVDHDAGIPTSSGYPLSYGTQPLLGMTGRHLAPGELCSLGHARALVLHRQPEGEPGALADSVVINLAKTEALEPRRGPRAHVSLRVMAVDDHGPVAIEPRRSGLIPFLQREIDRPREMALRVLSLRQHVYELGAALQQPLYLIAID